MNAVRTTRHQTAPAYPNAADRRYFLEKFIDGLLAAAICIGMVSVIFFLITMV